MTFFSSSASGSKGAIQRPTGLRLDLAGSSGSQPTEQRQRRQPQAPLGSERQGGSSNAIKADVEEADGAWELDSAKNVDPLDLYHRHLLDSNPHLTESIASDDDLLDLLRTTKDRAQLRWIEEGGLPLSAHPVPVTYPPWQGCLGQPNASVHSFESPTHSTASSARDSPESYWRSSASSSSAPSSDFAHFAHTPTLLTGAALPGSSDAALSQRTDSTSASQAPSSLFGSVGSQSGGTMASSILSESTQSHSRACGTSDSMDSQ